MTDTLKIRKVSRRLIEDLARRTFFGTENLGLCRMCGMEHDGCEPDAENYHCEQCGCDTVDGVQNLLLSI